MAFLWRFLILSSSASGISTKVNFLCSFESWMCFFLTGFRVEHKKVTISRSLFFLTRRVLETRYFMGQTLSPVSSSTSRIRPSRTPSPLSSLPPGRSQRPLGCFKSNTLPSETTTALAVTFFLAIFFRVFLSRRAFLIINSPRITYLVGVKRKPTISGSIIARSGPIRPPRHRKRGQKPLFEDY